MRHNKLYLDTICLELPSSFSKLFRFPYNNQSNKDNENYFTKLTATFLLNSMIYIAVIYCYKLLFLMSSNPPLVIWLILLGLKVTEK